MRRPMAKKRRRHITFEQALKERVLKHPQKAKRDPARPITDFQKEGLTEKIQIADMGFPPGA